MKPDNITEIKGQLVTLKHHRAARLFEIRVRGGSYLSDLELLLDEQQLLSLIDVIKSIEDE